MPMIFDSDAQIERIGRGLLDRSLPKAEWTHAAHFAAALWLLRTKVKPLSPQRCPTGFGGYNEATGVANTDSSGYHETISLPQSGSRVRCSKRMHTPTHCIGLLTCCWPASQVDPIGCFVIGPRPGCSRGALAGGGLIQTSNRFPFDPRRQCASNALVMRHGVARNDEDSVVPARGEEGLSQWPCGALPDDSTNSFLPPESITLMAHATVGTVRPRAAITVTWSPGLRA